MLRPRIGLSAVALSAVAATASVVVAWPSAVAQSSVKISAKQAAILGVPATEPAAPEEIVGSIIVKLRAGSQMAQAQGGAHVRALSNMAGIGVKAVRPMSDTASLVTLEAPVKFSQARALAARLASDPAVEYAEPDVSMKPFAVPNESAAPGLYTTKQWNLFAPATAYTGMVVVPMGMPAKNVTAPATGGANLPTAWDRTTGADTVVVAIVDTGIVNHPDLNNMGVAPFNATTYVPGGRFLPGYDFISLDPLGLGNDFVGNDGDGRDNNPADPGDAITAGDRANPLCNDNTTNQPNQDASTWHGTHSAGIVAATTDNAMGIAGIGWKVKVVPVRALGKCGGAMSDVADAILWAAGRTVTGVPVNANPAKIILVGAGGKVGTACSMTLQNAVDAAITDGAVVIAAAGNEGSALGISAPANCNNVISVTAHTIDGDNATYSNIGADAATGPTISAAGGGSPATFGNPGTNPADDPLWDGFYIWSTTPSGAGAPTAPLIYDKRIGTSPAAAQVAGVAALIKSIAPSATPVQIKSALTTSARPFPDLSRCAPGKIWAGRCGIGMLDATRALQAAGPPVVVTAPKAVTVAAGATASFTVDAIGVISYQWTRAGVAIAGATTSSYTTPALAAADNNVAFAVVMTNSFGATTSPAAVVTVSAGASSPSGGALPLWQLVLLSALLVAARVRVGYREQ